MVPELVAIVRSDGKDPVGVREEFPTNGLGNGYRRFGQDLLKQAKTRPPLDQRDDASFFLAADDGIGLPIAEPRAGLNYWRAFADRPAGIPTEAFAIFMDPLAVFVPPP